MANNNFTSSHSVDIPLIQKLFELYKLFHQFVIKFPKSDKYTLGQNIERNTLELIEITLACSTANVLIRKEKLLLASSKLDLIKLLVRLAYEVRALDQKSYIQLQEKLQEIGKMIGGWLRSTG